MANHNATKKSIRQTKRRKPQKKKKILKVKCIMCENLADLTGHRKYQYKKTGRAYCSRECSNLYRSKISSETKTLNMALIKSRLNSIYLIWLILFALIVLGIIPREIAIYATIGLLIYILLVPLEESVLFFVRSIPFFIALPLTSVFDNFNMWRILAVFIFLKWAWQGHFIKLFKIQFEFYKRPLEFIKSRPIYSSLTGLLALAILSTFVAPDKIIALKRVLYFSNLSLVGIVLYDLFARDKLELKNTLVSLAIPTILVTLAGLLQVISTYFWDIFQFIDFWGWGVQARQFGEQWAYIAVELGNTWFAYYGEQLSLRVFSLFPDSHSFPVFLLLGLPAVFALALKNLQFSAVSLQKLIKTRAKILVVAVPLVFLMAILSGTRGIWAGWVGAVFLAIGITLWLKGGKVPARKYNLFRYVGLYLVAFVTDHDVDWHGEEKFEEFLHDVVIDNEHVV